MKTWFALGWGILLVNEQIPGLITYGLGFSSEVELNKVMIMKTWFALGNSVGQWADTRANTVYGLGFSSEVELNKVMIMKTWLL